MSVNMFLDGLDDLRKALRDMPDDLTNEAIGLVAAAAHDTETDLKAVYPDGPMQDAVVITDRSQVHQAKFVVESRSEAAVWWEFGTQNRTTQQGWNRGAAPAHKDTGLVSIAKRHRTTLYQALVALVERAGFTIREAA